MFLKLHCDATITANLHCDVTYHHLAQCWSEFQAKKTVRMLQIVRVFSSQRPRYTINMPTRLCDVGLSHFILSLARVFSETQL